MTDIFLLFVILTGGAAAWGLRHVALGLRLLSRHMRAPERRERRARA